MDSGVLTLQTTTACAARFGGSHHGTSADTTACSTCNQRRTTSTQFSWRVWKTGARSW